MYRSQNRHACAFLFWKLVVEFSVDSRHLERWPTRGAAIAAALCPTPMIITSTCVLQCRPPSCWCSGTTHSTSSCCWRSVPHSLLSFALYCYHCHLCLLRSYISRDSLTYFTCCLCCKISANFRFSFPCRHHCLRAE